jgi:hypothetical protein
MSMDIIKKYKEQRDRIKKHFEAERTGEQVQYIDQVKLFKPLLESQKESSRSIQDKIVSSQDTLSNALVPFTTELRKRNEQIDELQALPFYDIPREIEGIKHSTPVKDRSVIEINLDGELLEESHRENLSILDLELPSEVQKKGDFKSVFEKIGLNNRKLGQYLRKDNEKTKREGLTERYTSQQIALKIYTDKIKGLEGASQFITKSGEGLRKKQHKLCKLKRGKGRPRIYPPTIYYNSVSDLCEKLNELVAARKAGNTGLDNSINEVLDELLRTGSIDKNDYNILFKNIFS